MYLNENIAQLNKMYKECGIEFRFQKSIIPQESIINVVEERPFILNNYPHAKDNLKKKYFMKFNDKHKWYIGQQGVKYLKSRKIKIKPSYDIKDLKNKLQFFIEMITEIELKESIRLLIHNHDIFYESPAARVHHHAYEGGLLEHTVQTTEFALALVSKMDKEVIIDKDLIIAGSILHDIGKINCYNYSKGSVEITDIFLEQEHIINGVKIVSQEIKSGKLDDLIHIIASHHNISEWGSPISPNSNEAWIIHFAENLSSKISG